MRQNIIVALLVVCAMLLTANLLKSSKPSSGAFPMAFGQAAQSGSGSLVMSTANTQSEVFCFLLDPTSKKLCAYSVKGRGIDLKGIRAVSVDFTPSLQEYPTSNSPTAVKNMKKVIDAAK